MWIKFFKPRRKAGYFCLCRVLLEKKGQLVGVKSFRNLLRYLLLIFIKICNS